MQAPVPLSPPLFTSERAARIVGGVAPVGLAESSHIQPWRVALGKRRKRRERAPRNRDTPSSREINRLEQQLAHVKYMPAMTTYVALMVLAGTLILMSLDPTREKDGREALAIVLPIFAITWVAKLLLTGYLGQLMQERTVQALGRARRVVWIRTFMSAAVVAAVAFPLFKISGVFRFLQGASEVAAGAIGAFLLALIVELAAIWVASRIFRSQRQRGARNRRR